VKKFARVAVAVAAMLVALLGLSACNDRPCVQGHYNYVPVVHTTGKTTYTTIQPVWNCDEYGKKPE
jgi:hypothetical protein